MREWQYPHVAVYGGYIGYGGVPAPEGGREPAYVGEVCPETGFV